MKYTLDMELAASRDKVFSLFTNPENMPRWQPSFISHKHLSSTPGKEGARTKLVHKFGRSNIEMVETIERNNARDEYIAIYKAKGAWNRSVNRFEETGPNATRWIVENEFKCSGFLRVMAFFAPGMFKKQTHKDMERFKAFAEAQSS